MDLEKMAGLSCCIFILGLLGLLFNSSSQAHDCRLKAIEKGMPAIEIQAICK